MEYEVQKLFQGCASVRSYIVHKCMELSEPLVILFKSEKMTVSPDELGDFKILSNQLYHSKFNGQHYKLIDYEFIPDNDKNQLDLFKIKS